MFYLTTQIQNISHMSLLIAFLKEINFTGMLYI